MNSVSSSAAQAVVVSAPGKLNPGCAIGGLRADGYHELATLLIAVSCYEEVTITREPRLRVTVSGIAADQVPTDRSNLAARAAILLAEHCDLSPDVHMHIRKRIPTCGGMAGGSADAAAALAGCNQLWNTGLGTLELAKLASDLGSDVPFCVLGGAAVARGRGELLEPIAAAGPYHWVLAIADGGGLSTPDMFAAWDERHRDAPSTSVALDLSAGLLPAFASGDPRRLADALANDFEPLAMERLPSLLATREAGLKAGALAGLLAGTGATYAFLAEGAVGARLLAERLSASGTCGAVKVVRGPVAGPEVVAVH